MRLECNLARFKSRTIVPIVMIILFFLFCPLILIQTWPLYAVARDFLKALQTIRLFHDNFALLINAVTFLLFAILL